MEAHYVSLAGRVRGVAGEQGNDSVELGLSLTNIHEYSIGLVENPLLGLKLEV
jgi:hypothetical protein